MSSGRLVVHAHFYQPSRTDPFNGQVPVDPSAAPAHDWNARVSAECYRPNAELGNLGHISWDLGPTLASWMRDNDPGAYAGFVAGDQGVNGMAQAYHHSILPLASAEDRRTEIRWGLRDFEVRFGRRASGMWLPETAVDLATLRVLAEHGVRHTILAPWQVADVGVETRRPYRVELGDGRHIVVALYDAGLSGAASFETAMTADADHFTKARLDPRFAQPLAGAAPPVVVIATDGELYGHHQPFRDLFLKRLVQPGPHEIGRTFTVSTLSEALREPAGRPFEPVQIAERTSWSCHHGLLRWTAACPCVKEGGWKGPLRSAFERLAGGIDTLTERLAAALPGQPDPWAARDAFIDVLVGTEERATFAERWLGDRGSPDDARILLDLMDVQRWRLAMFASDAWFWDDPVRVETMNALRAAAWASRRIDSLAGSGLERRLVADLALLTSPDELIDGARIYRRALAQVGQP